ncbi:MAG: ABC transporter substrate-binding protein, partial [Geminicoccales bacterium]
GPIGLICDQAAGVKSPADLKGKRVGSTPTGSDAQVLPAFLGTTGIETGEITIVNMQGDAKLAALMTDKVDCISGDGFFWAPRAEAAGKAVDVILYADHGVTNLAYGIIAGEEFLKNHPDVVRRFLAATMKAYAYTFANIEEAADIFLAKTGSPQTRDFVVGTLQYYKDQLHTKATAGKPMGWMAEEDWDSMNAALEKFGGMTGRKPASAYFTNEFVPSS